MKTIFALLFCLSLVSGLVSCGASESSRLADQGTLPAAGAKTIEGQPAQDLIGLLFKAGIRDPSGKLGAVHLSLDGIECSAAVVPNPIPSCTLIVDGNLRPLDTNSAQLMYILLKQSGATVPSTLLGTIRVSALAIDCQRSLTLNGTTRCTFLVPSQN
jgi:hypothetical protein